MKDFVTGANLVPAKRYVVDLRYSAGLGVRLRDILSGDVKARLKIKIAFFSKSWSKTLVKFNGMCPGSPDADLGSPCNLTLVSFDGSTDAASGAFPWGTVRASQPFPQLARLSAAAPSGIGRFDASQTEKLFFDSLCTCIDGNDTSEARECFRSEDCCPGTPRCFSDPARSGKSSCITCRHRGESCKEKADCCGGICFNGTCEGQHGCGGDCRSGDDCKDGLPCDGGRCFTARACVPR